MGYTGTVSMYSSVSEVDAHALANGEIDFLRSDDAGISCTADGAVLINGTALTVQGISPAGEAIIQYDLLKIGEEYARVNAVNGLALTIARGFGDTAPAAIADNDPIQVKTQLKIRLISAATRDIQRIHRVRYPGAGATLWYETNADLRLACAMQVVWLAKYNEERELAQRLKIITGSSYSDGVLSVQYPEGQRYAEGVEDLVTMVAKAAGVYSGGFLRG